MRHSMLPLVCSSVQRKVCQHGVVFTNTPASFGTFISEETEKCGKAIR
jgi:hypothetical protein